MATRYILDTSLFVNGWRKHYQPDVFPSVWNSLDRLIMDGVAFSCQAVYSEIEEQRDELFAWVKKHRKQFERPCENVTLTMQEIMRSFPNIAAKGGSRNAADPWLIAHARHRGAVIVTTEEPLPQVKATKPPKIPNICLELDMPWMNPVAFFKENGLVF